MEQIQDIYIGDQLDRWNEQKEVLRVQTHSEVAKSLLDSDIKTEENKKAERLKTMEKRKAKARLQCLPTNDPWSVNIHENYSKRDDNKLQKQSASMNKPTTTVNRSTERNKSQDDIQSSRTSQVRQSETSIFKT